MKNKYFEKLRDAVLERLKVVPNFNPNGWEVEELSTSEVIYRYQDYEVNVRNIKFHDYKITVFKENEKIREKQVKRFNKLEEELVDILIDIEHDNLKN